MVQTELFYPSYAHRAAALDLFVREVAPALRWPFMIDHDRVGKPAIRCFSSMIGFSFAIISG